MNNFINQAANNSIWLVLMETLRSILLSAKCLNVPVYLIGTLVGILSYEQGKKLSFLGLSASELNSQIGGVLRADKTKINKYLELPEYSTT